MPIILSGVSIIPNKLFAWDIFYLIADDMSWFCLRVCFTQIFLLLLLIQVLAISKIYPRASIVLRSYLMQRWVVEQPLYILIRNSGWSYSFGSKPFSGVRFELPLFGLVCFILVYSSFFSLKVLFHTKKEKKTRNTGVVIILIRRQ